MKTYTGKGKDKGHKGQLIKGKGKGKVIAIKGKGKGRVDILKMYTGKGKGRVEQ